MHYLDGLNERQREAVLHTEGPLLIIAGAGAGKTRVITHRILYLIKKGVAPESILAITFTNKAAKEMRDRVYKLISSEVDKLNGGELANLPTYKLTNSPWIGTFHALGVHIIRENSRRLNLPRHFTIFDKADSLSAVKEAIKRTSRDPREIDPSGILSVVSREKGNMTRLPEFRERAMGESFREIVAEIWTEYEKILKEETALDFDDLLLKTAWLLQKEESVREHYQSRFRFIHIDEYQDTNHVQYIMARLLVDGHRNIAVVGDIDQCLLPDARVQTPTGEKEVKDIKKGDVVRGASGNGEMCSAKVSQVKTTKYTGAVVQIKTESGHTVRLTPEHILFSRLDLTRKAFYVYLMYRRDKGFRIGLAKSIRQNGRGKNAVGLLVRCNQEKADKMWVLKMCTTKREALYWEIYFSSRYGIPTLVFLTGNRSMTIEQKDINKIFRVIDTRRRAEKLFLETGMNFDCPHYFPQGTTQSNAKRERLNINLNMFGDRRKSLISPWGMSRVSINTPEPTLKQALENAGFKTRRGKRNDWRLEIARLDYGETERIAKKILTLKPNLTLVRNAFITKGTKMLFQPAANIIPGMMIGVVKQNKVMEERVTSVTRKRYTGKVYDLNIDKIHNYIANNVVVHNCIYGWRGASIKNILHFEKDYPQAKIVLLEENYRSTKTILAVANRIIEKNKLRREKTLFTRNGAGEKLGLFTAFDEGDEAAFAALKAKELIEQGTEPREIAVLFRANFQSRALEEAFMSADVPYQVLGVRFFERKEVKDVIAYVRAARTTFVEPARQSGAQNLNGQASSTEGLSDIRRIINVPPRGLGKVTVLKIFAGKETELPSAMQEKLASFRRLLAELKKKLGNEPLSSTLKWMVTASGLEAELKKGGSDDAERLENIMELVTFATRYDSPVAGTSREEAVSQFLADVALQSDQDELKEERDAVRLMTVHASKGLEFEYVFITGLEQDLFPHTRLDEEEPSREKAEEERRLFYVALTRAKKKVFLSYAGVRTIFGARQVSVPSEFIFDIDEELLEPEHVPYSM